MSKRTYLWAIYYGILLFILAVVFSSCSFSLFPKMETPKVETVNPDTVVTVKVDTVWTKSVLTNIVNIDSLQRVIESLNDDRFPDTGNTIDERDYWRDRSQRQDGVLKEQAFMIRELIEKLNKIPPATRTTIERTVTKPQPQDNNMAALIAGISAIVAFVVGKFLNKKK